MPSVALGTTFSGSNGETFTITDFLGQGAFGEVYRAVGETSGLTVAVKLLPVGALASPDSKIALLNEIKTAQQIEHPNVVRQDDAKQAYLAYGGANWARAERTQIQALMQKMDDLIAVNRDCASQLEREFSALAQERTALIAALSYEIAAKKLPGRCDLVPFWQL